MKTSNGYIGTDRAYSLIQNGWIFRQNLAQTEFKVKRTPDATDHFKLNQKSAAELKSLIKQNKQVKINL
jgi:hypothetical protein